jgi:hypothetical protein
MLLGSSANRRLTKDERQSPAMAEAPMSAPALPRETDEDCRTGREKDGCGEPTPSLGAAKQRTAVSQHNPAVDRIGKAPSQESREHDRSAVSDDNED